MSLNIRRKRPKLGGAVYVLPNLITTGNLFFGFSSIIKGLKFDFEGAALAILLAAVFDILDGRVARMTGGTSEFGVQYDSLCDLVSFGLAPAFLMYQAGLSQWGRMGWVICFLYLACGALRLARFNVQSAIGKASGDFTGLPIPMAAGFVACYVAVYSIDLQDLEPRFEWLGPVLEFLNRSVVRSSVFAVAGLGLALAMVSNITYRSHKAIRVSGIRPFRLLVSLVVLTGLIAYRPALLGLILFTLYAISGPVEWMLGWQKPTDDQDIFAEEDDDEDGAQMDPNHPH